MKQPKVHIVLLNWNGWQDTLECLESVLRQDYPDYQVIVCDNASGDGSLEKIELWCRGELEAPVGPESPLKHLSAPSVSKPVSYVRLTREDAENPDAPPVNHPLVLIETGGNLGFAGGNNVGFRYLLNQRNSDYVWVLNNDTVVEPDALKAMVETLETGSAKGQPGTCGSLVCFYDDPEIVQALGGPEFNPRSCIASQTLGRFLRRDEPVDHAAYARRMDYITGCSWLLPVQFLHDVGLMEEGYFLYYEEIDWVTRAGDRYTHTYAPDSVIYHKEGSSVGSKTMNRGPSQLAEFYMARSRLAFCRKFYPKNLPYLYLTLVLQAVNRVRQGHFKNARLLLQVARGKRDFKPL
ncbi:MAG: glycosyltransferase family 2 protein [Pontibacterium sp.]